MKQKNVLLMVVAVACGLAAAVLTTQMTGKTAAPDQVEILVAAKELPVGQKLEKEKLAELIKKKKVNKADVPAEGAYFSEEEITDKYLTRPRGTNDTLLASDVSATKPGIVVPDGKHLVTMKLPYEHIGPFIEPGTKVDVECAVQTAVMPQLRQFLLMADIPVLAVDTAFANGAQKGPEGRPAINTVTVALSLEESKWYHIATRLGADIRFLVRSEKTPKVKVPTDDELARLFFEPDAGGTKTAATDKAKSTKVRLWVAREFLAAGTEITADAIKDKFKEKEFDEADVPKDAVTDLNEYLGKYLLKDAYRAEPLPIDTLGDKPAEKPAPVKPATTAQADPPQEPKTEQAPRPHRYERKPIKTHEIEILNGTKGTEKHRYEMFDEKEGWVYKGVVGKDGTVTPSTPPDKGPDAPKDGKIS